MEMTPETIKALLDAFDGSDWREMIVTVGDDRLHVSRDPLPEGASLAPPPATVPSESAVPAGHPPIGSPSVGHFWRSPSPGAPPFVEVGATVAAGTPWQSSR